MKKLLSLLLCLLLWAAPAVPALADLFWEPEDDFYRDHFDAVQRDGSDYEAAADAPIRKSPEDEEIRGAIAAGDTVRVYYRWEDWGYILLPEPEGWVDLSGFRRLCGESDFRAAHEDEITSERRTVSREEHGTIYLWTYPGSGTVADVIDSAAFAWAEDDPACDALWTDGDGLLWGHLTYYYGVSGGWICLDDPGADDLPAVGPRYADEEGEGSAEPAGSPALPAE